ncbi:MAG: hypothetical protein AAF850_05870 [Pseudomonadota bacterium]
MNMSALAIALVAFSSLEPETESTITAQQIQVAEAAFENNAVMGEESLREARGGFVVGDDFVEFGGFFIGFVQQSSEISFQTEMMSGVIDTGLQSVLLNNALDDVVITRDTVLNAFVPTATTSSIAIQTEAIVGGAINNATLLSPLN